DGGESWDEPNVGMRPDCPRIVYNRVTALAACPNDPDHLWAGVEIDGTYHSDDGGRSWRPIGAGLSSRDIPALARGPGGDGRTRLLAATNNDLNVSEDGGETWEPLGMRDRLPWPYTRALAQRADRPEMVLLGAGDGPPGSEGLIALSRDKGET